MIYRYKDLKVYYLNSLLLLKHTNQVFLGLVIISVFPTFNPCLDEAISLKNPHTELDASITSFTALSVDWVWRGKHGTCRAPFGSRSPQLWGAWVCTWAELQNFQGGVAPSHQTETRWTEKEKFLCLSAPLVKAPHFSRLMCWMRLARYSRNFSGWCGIYYKIPWLITILLYLVLFACFLMSWTSNHRHNRIKWIHVTLHVGNNFI